MTFRLTHPDRNREQGLALVGSLLLVSMLAVMSTAFLLLMAADVRIAQSHFQSTQAYYLAESAAEIAFVELTNQPWLAFPADSTLPILTDTLGIGWYAVYSYPAYHIPPNNQFMDFPPEIGVRELRIRAGSGKASYDLFIEVQVPNDPRLFFPVVADISLRLENTNRVVGGNGILYYGSDPELTSAFSLNCPSSGDSKLYVGGTFFWGAGGISNVFSDSLDVLTDLSAYSSSTFPQILDSENSPYPYHITGDPTEYYAEPITVQTVTPGDMPAIDPISNPMSIYVWDFDVDGSFDGNFNITGTIVSPGTGRFRFNNGNVTLTPKRTPTSPVEEYPALVCRGTIHIRGSGARNITGLIYASDEFSSDPAWPGTFTLSGMIIGSQVRLRDYSTVTYRDELHIMPIAALRSSVLNPFPAIVFHRRRYLDLP